MAWTLAQYQAALKASQEEANRLNLLAVSTKQESSSAKAAADAAAAKAVETKNIVDTAGYNLKRTQQTAAENAAKANQLAAQQAADAAAKAKQTESAKRAAEFTVTSKAYDLSIAKNPFTDLEEREQQWAINNQFGKGNRRKFIYSWEKSEDRYNAQQQQAKQEAEKKLRYDNLTADGFQFASGGTGQRDFGKAVADYKMGRPLGYRKISARGQNQFNLWLAKEDLLYGRISQDEYRSRTGQSQSKLKVEQQAQVDRAVAKSKASLYGRARAENQQWAEKINNPETRQNQLTGASIMDVKQAPVNESRINDPLNNEYSVDGTAVSAKEKSNISNIIARQRAQEEINREQQKLFNTIRNAPNAAAALKLRGAAMAQNPNVGTYNALFRGNELQSTSGVFGIGDGTVKDLNYNKFDRATQTFAENPKLGNLTDSQGNIIASNLKSSSGSEWNFSPVPQQTAKEESERTIAQGIPVPPTAAGFLGGLSLFAQSPSPSSGTVSTQSAVPTYEISLASYNDNLEIFETKWEGVEEFTSQEQADEYAADFDALNFQYDNLSNEFEIQQKENEEWGGYLPEDQGWYSYVQNEIRPKDIPRNELGNVNDPVTGSLVKVGWNTVAAINNLGVWGSKAIDPKTYKDTEYVKYYSTPVTNVESAAFGSAAGTVTQGFDFWNSGTGTKLIDNEKKQIGKNVDRNWQEAGLTTGLELLFYPIAGTARVVQKGATKLLGTLGQTAESGAKAGVKGTTSSAPKPPTNTPSYTEWQKFMKMQNSQQGIPSSLGAYGRQVIKDGKAAGYSLVKDPPKPKDPTPSELKLFDGIVSGKIKKVPDVKVPTIFKNVGKVADDLPIIKTNDLPVKPKDGNLPKRPNDLGFPIRIKDPTGIKTPDPILAPTPKGGKRGFVLPFGFPAFGGRSGSGGVGYKGKPQSKRKFTAWDVRTDKIGFYGFGRKSDSYGGVFGELDQLDKVAKSEKKTKSKEKKSGFDEVFNFNFDF